MKRGSRRPWVVDWSGDNPVEPLVGHVVLKLTPTQQSSFWRVTGVRQMVHRKPLRPGYTARYRVTAEPITEPYPCQDWTLHDRPQKRPMPRSIEHDPFSPLL